MKGDKKKKKDVINVLKQSPHWRRSPAVILKLASKRLKDVLASRPKSIFYDIYS